MDDRQPDAREIGRLWAFGQVGFEMVVPIGIGWWLDYQFGWVPWGVVVGAALGFAVGILHMVALTRRSNGAG